MELTENLSFNILVVDDELAIAELIALSLSHCVEKAQIEIDKVQNAEQALFMLQNKKYHLACLDWMLPQMQGLELIQKLRSLEIELQILMITAKADAVSIVEGLRAGADDYVIKPFDTQVLAARARNLLLRSTKRLEPAPFIWGKNEVYEHAGLKIDSARAEVKVNEELIHLTPSEFKLLSLLIKSQGRVLTRDQLIDLIQGEDVTVTGRTIDTHVFALRKKLKNWSENIETIRGVGYRVVYQK